MKFVQHIIYMIFVYQVFDKIDELIVTSFVFVKSIENTPKGAIDVLNYHSNYKLKLDEFKNKKTNEKYR